MKPLIIRFFVLLFFVLPIACAEPIAVEQEEQTPIDYSPDCVTTVEIAYPSRFIVSAQEDVDGEIPGIQLDVPIFTTLHEGALLELIIEDQHGNVQWELDYVEVDGSSMFYAVTIPAGISTATAASIDCSGEDSVTFAAFESTPTPLPPAM